MTWSVCAWHLACIGSFGATFWTDQRVYFAIARVFASREALVSFYADQGTWMFSHVGPGAPAACALLGLLPTPLQWPVLAFAQHAFAAFATLLAFREVLRLRDSWWVVGCAVAFTMVPFVQAFHNAPLTESIAGSAILATLGLALRWLRTDKVSGGSIAAATCFALLAAAMRGYLGAAVIGILLACAPMLASRAARIRCLSAAGAGACAAAVAVMLLPALRWNAGLGWTMPSLGAYRLFEALEVAPADARASTLAAVRGTELEGVPEEQYLVNTRKMPFELLKGAQRWRSWGATDAEIAERFARIAELVESRTPLIIRQRIAAGAVSCGLLAMPAIIARQGTWYSSLDWRAYRESLRSSHLQSSWTKAADPRKAFESFMQQRHFPSDPDLKDRMRAAYLPWMWPESRALVAVRDPLFTRSMPPEALPAIGLAGLALALVRQTRRALLASITVVVTFVVCAMSLLGNPRYSYANYGPMALGCALATVPREGRRRSVAERGANDGAHPAAATERPSHGTSLH